MKKGEYKLIIGVDTISQPINYSIPIYHQTSNKC